MHRRVVGREAVGVRVPRDVRDAQRDAVADDRAEQAVTLRQRPDLAAQLRRHAAGDEALDPTVRVDDPERRVARADELAHAVDDQLQDAVEVQLAGDGPRRPVERVEGVV